MDENHPVHPNHVYRRSRLTLGQRWADRITVLGGSWTFIGLFALFLLSWIAVNTYLLLERPVDPFPYILLNLLLSCLAAIQAPVILMSQNRQTERDRAKAEQDYKVNRKAEREIENVQKDLDEIKEMIRAMSRKG